MNKTALIIGRFQPLHLGHIDLIRRYYKAGFFIKIGIGSSDMICSKHNPLTAKERLEQVRLAMKELKINKYKVFLIPDIENDENFVEHVIRIVGSFNTIITGNSKVLRLFVVYEHKKPWNIESFHESISRPGHDVTSGVIRKLWLKGSSKKGLLASTFNHLKAIKFSERLKGLC